MQHLDQMGDDVPALHLLLDGEVLRHVQQNGERNVEQLVLLRNHLVEPSQMSLELVPLLFRHLVLLQCLLVLLFAQLEVLVPNLKPLNLILDYLHRRVPDFLLDQNWLELLVIAKNIEHAH